MIWAFSRQLALILLLAATSPSRGDTVKLTNRPAFRNVAVVGFRGGRVIFRGVSGQYLRKPLPEVEWLTIAGAPDLSAAERATTTGDWGRAVPTYEAALEAAGERWLRDLVRFRLLTAYDRAGRFDRAVALYVELLGAHPDLAARFAPRHPGPVDSDVNRQARATLVRVLAADAASPGAGALRALQLELMLYEGLERRPEARTAPTTSGPATTSLPSTGPASDGPIGILGGDEAKPRPAPASSPAVQLPSDSFVLDAAQAACDAEQYSRAVQLIELALPHVASAEQGPWRLLLGRCRIRVGRPAEAASDLLSLAETDPDAARAALALYYAGLAHERMGRADVAGKLYEELLQRADVDAEVKTRARQALDRMKR